MSAAADALMGIFGFNRVESEMKTDRELLELAARAAGYQVDTGFADCPLIYGSDAGPDGPREWNPLTDDGDALRLAVKLCIHTEIYEAYTEATAVNHETDEYWQINQASASPGCSDMMTATRRAIVRAAAAIVESMHD